MIRKNSRSLQTEDLRNVLTAGVSALAVALGAPAHAQELETVPTQDDEAVDEEDRIVVTGSRIRQPEFASSNPVVSLDAQNLSYSGETNLTDYLQSLPALVNSFDAEDSADTGNSNALIGVNLLDLRNLGTDRTLVLVDGRRHVSTIAGSAAVDVNTIPVGLIERVEVLTGGASAIYGADGVSGVVNFIMKKDFEGLTTRAQYGFTPDHGYESEIISVLAGKNFDDGRGNFTLAFDFANEDPLGREDRAFSALGTREIFTQNPADTGPMDMIPDLILAANVRYPDTSPQGSIDVGPIGTGSGGFPFNYDFLGDGREFQFGEFGAGFFAIGGSGSPVALFEDELLPGNKRFTGNSTVRYEIADGHSMFAEMKYNRSEATFIGQPTYDFFMFLPTDLAYIPDNILAAANTPGNYGDSYGLIFMARDHIDLGPITRDVNRNTYRGVLGFEGNITDDLEYNISYTYGRTVNNETTLNNRSNERFWAAIDAVDDGMGNIVCRSDLAPGAIPIGAIYADYFGLGGGFDPALWGSTFTPGADSGCVPADIFGADISPEARDWINGTLEEKARIEQHVLSGYFSGQTPDMFGLFELPYGPLGFAVGGEWRKEKSLFFTVTDSTITDVAWIGGTPRTAGEFEVIEGFAEVNLPLLADLPGIQRLDVDGAVRISDYSTAGYSKTWKGGFMWEVIDDITFRGTWAKATRAPNIADLFLPPTQTFALLADPCDIDNVNAGTSFRVGNCNAELMSLGIDPATYNDTFTGSRQGTISGNTDLDVEDAITKTVGVILRPRFVPGLSIALDYYDIELDRAITTITAQSIFDNCYDLPQPNQFCDLITRNSATGNISSFQQSPVNIAEFLTEGWDLTVRYNFDPIDLGITDKDVGTFSFTFIGNHVEELTFVEDFDAPPDPLVGEGGGEIGAPAYQAAIDLTWFYKNLTINYGFSWFDRTLRTTPERLTSNPLWLPLENQYFSERKLHDIQVRYRLNDIYEVYAGVNNFMNQLPDVGSTSYPVSPRGRYVYFGFTTTFDKIPTRPGDLW